MSWRWRRPLSRRELIVGSGALGASLAAGRIAHDALQGEASALHPAARAAPAAIKPGLPIPGFLTGFEHGRLVDGVRHFELEAINSEIEVADGIRFKAWTYNGQAPGPTLRARAGERMAVHFVNHSDHPHTVHFHGVHGSFDDGVPGQGAGEIAPGRDTTYHFTARPFGLHLYHCHSSPLGAHMARGLYGAFVIDPPERRPPAHEVVLVLSAFDLDDDGTNDVYALNGRAFAHMNEMIDVPRGELVRFYLVNALEHDPVNSLHLHANFFNVFPTGTSLTPTELTDTVMLCQAQRAVLEVTFHHFGSFMMHAHQARFADLGWAAMVNVV